MFVSVSDIRGQVIVANKHVYSWLIFQTLVWTYSQVRGVNTILLQCTFVTKVLMSESFSEMSYCGVKHCKNSVVYRTRIVRMAHVPILRFHCPPRSRFVCLNAVLSKVTFSREGHKFPGQRHWFEWNFNDELGRAAQWYCNLISSHTCKPLILNALLLKSRVKFYWGQLNIWSVASVANRKVSNPAVQICEPLLAWSH